MRHFRIKNDQDRFIGGEWESFEAAKDYSRRQVMGFSTVVECDRYGNELRPKKAEVIDST